MPKQVIKSKRILLFIFSFFIFHSSVYSQNVYSKDKVRLFSKDEWQKNCVTKPTFKFKSMEIGMYDYCSCIADIVFPNFNSWEIKKAMNENKFGDLIMNEKHIVELINCLKLSLENIDYTETPNLHIRESEQNKLLSIKYCTSEILNSPETKNYYTVKSAEEYCTCAINHLYDKGYKYTDLQKLNNSSVINQILEKCVH